MKGRPLPYIDVTAVVAAVDKLIALLDCGNPRVEVATARTILALSNKLIEDDLKARVSLLESAFSERLKRL